MSGSGLHWETRETDVLCDNSDNTAVPHPLKNFPKVDRDDVHKVLKI